MRKQWKLIAEGVGIAVECFMRYGFSLVELSIVLVILGLLAGGILSGQSLIRAAELRSVSTQYGNFASAINTFRDKYFAAPGDMNNATSFWGTDSNCTGVTTASGTCNGNGDGVINYGTAGATAENFQFWRQLALGGLIEGQYTGKAGAGNPKQNIPGTNSPRGKLSSGAWDTANASNFASPGNHYFYDYGNYLLMGKADTTYDLQVPVLKPEEAWNIDTKFDDGKPGTGKITPGLFTGCTNATSESDYASGYKLDSSAVACILYFVKQY